MKPFLVSLGFLWVSCSAPAQQEIRIPALGPYFKHYEPGIRRQDPITLMEVYVASRTESNCIVIDEQSKTAILKKAEALAAAGNGYAMYLMARAVVGGSERVTFWYQRAAEAGDPYAQYWIAGRKKDVERIELAILAGKTLLKRAEQGDRMALYHLQPGGRLYKVSLCSKEKEDELEAKLLQGKDRWAYKAMSDRATLRLDPNVTAEKEEALRLAHTAAEGGEIEAMKFLQFYYYEGGCPREYRDPKKSQKRDIPKAWEWARRQWEAMGCTGPMPDPPLNYEGDPWRKPGESEAAYRKRTGVRQK